MADFSKFTEEMINFLTVHTYDPGLQITHPEHKKLDSLKLFDFIPQELKSLNDYLQTIVPFINLPALDDYISDNIVFMLGDYPAQYFGCKAVAL